MTAVVVDTNVAVVANGKARQAGPACIMACIAALRKALRDEIIVLDRGRQILDEYRRHLSPSGQPGVGDAFFKFLWQNQANPDRCELVDLHPKERSAENFDEFPDDPESAGFDRQDRKFVAAARASKLDPTVLNATDTDWWEYREVLARHDVRVKFLCPDLMRVRH